MVFAFVDQLGPERVPCGGMSPPLQDLRAILNIIELVEAERLFATVHHVFLQWLLDIIHKRHASKHQCNIISYQIVPNAVHT